MTDPYLTVLRDVRRKIPRSLDIKIEEDDIEAGEQCNGRHCPTVLATMRVAKPLGAAAVIVGGDIAHIYFDIPTPFNRQTVGMYRLPGKLQGWIRNYDNHHPSRGVPSSELKPVKPIRAKLEFKPYEFDEDYQQEAAA